MPPQNMDYFQRRTLNKAIQNVGAAYNFFPRYFSTNESELL